MIDPRRDAEEEEDAGRIADEHLGAVEGKPATTPKRAPVVALIFDQIARFIRTRQDQRGFGGGCERVALLRWCGT